MSRFFVINILIVVSLIGCSSSEIIENDNKKRDLATPEEIYRDAKILFDNGEYISAEQEFIKLNRLYPLSNESIQAEIMTGFISYVRLEYDKAINRFDKIIIKYPSLKNLDYVFYMKAICYYEQISHHGLDGEFNDLALENLNQVIKRFPNSEYAKDSRQKIILVKSNQAAKHMDIGRFYLNEKKYTAALSRFKIVIDDYSMTKFAPEALHRMVEAYYEMGMLEESSNTASILGYNYPNSKWYRYSYNLIKKIDKEETLFKKMTDIF